MRSVPSLYRLTRHYIYNKMRSVPSLYRLTRHYIYNKMRAVPWFTIKWDHYPAFIDTGHYTRDTIFTIKWDQYPAFINLRDTRHYIYNKMRSVSSLYRYEALYVQ